MFKENSKYIVTADNWFIAPDGRSYKAAWGSIKFFADDVLPIKTNRNSTNWFLRVGADDRHVIIAGCHIHYAVLCEQEPFLLYSERWEPTQLDEQGNCNPIKHQTEIYAPELTIP